MSVFSELSIQERDKYRHVWRDIEQYGDHSPAERRRDEIVSDLQRHKATSVIDLGVGCGRLAHVLEVTHGYQVTPLDIADNSMDHSPALYFGDRLIIQSLFADDFSIDQFDYGICIDVLEHLPNVACLEIALDNIRRHCVHGMLVPACFGSSWGLHPIVESSEWWREKIREILPFCQFTLEKNYCIARF